MIRRIFLILATVFLFVGIVWAQNGGGGKAYPFVIAPAAILVAWLGSFEWRMRNKVNVGRFGDLKDSVGRIESHIYDILKAQHIQPTIEPPEEIKNNSNGKG